jgi:hypothetical protein
MKWRSLSLFDGKVKTIEKIVHEFHELRKAVSALHVNLPHGGVCL